MLDPIDINYRLMKAGSSQAELAIQLDTTRANVWNVIHGRSRSARVEDAISDLVSAAKCEIWPQWYGPDGKPIKKRRRVLTKFERAANFAALAEQFAAASSKSANKQAA